MSTATMPDLARPTPATTNELQDDPPAVTPHEHDDAPLATLSVQVPAALMGRIRGAAWAVGGSLSGSEGHVSRAMTTYIEHLEREHNHGVPFPPKDSLPTGPRRKSTGSPASPQ